MKRSTVAKGLCYWVTICVLLGLFASGISREYEVLLSGTDGKHYPSALYHVLPVPGTSASKASPGATGADFSQVYTSARSLLAGHSAYRKPNGRTTDLFGRPAGYPPLMNWIYVPFAKLSYVDALLTHTVFWAAAFVSVSLLLLHSLNLLRHGFAFVAVFASLYCLTPIGYTHIERGQFDLVVATATVLAMMCVLLPRNQYLLASIVGLMGALKWTAVSYLGCFAALGFLIGPNKRRVPFALIPSMMALGTFSFWKGVLEYWPTIQKYEIDATPNGVTFEWFLPRMVVKAIPVVITLVVAGFICLRGRNEADRRQLLLAVIGPFSVALMCVAICFGTLSYEYHTVVMLGVLPGVIAWIERAPLVRLSQRRAVAISLGGFLPFAFRVFSFGDSLEPQTITSLYGLLAAYMLYTCCSIILRASPALIDSRPLFSMHTRALSARISAPRSNAARSHEGRSDVEAPPTDTSHRNLPGNASLSGWAMLSLYAAGAAVLLTNLASFLPPAKHRFVDMLQPGAADLIPTVNAAHALLSGDNPYHNTQFLVPDPYFYSRGESEGFSYLYPPSHALLYVPITWLANGNFFTAIRLQFVVSLVCIFTLAWLVVRLLRSIVQPDSAQLGTIVPAVCLVLGLNVGNLLGIERGQSDLITSVFAWSAVFCFCRRRLGLTAFLAIAAALLKGYGLYLAAGLVVLAILENWRSALVGVCAALACLLAPVSFYLPDALQAYRIRSAMFWSGWTNQGFSNLAFSIGLPRDGGRVAFTAIAILSAAAAWCRLFSLRHSQDDQARSLWATAFATSALTSIVGYSLNSISYAVVIVMPGALVLMLAQEQLFPKLAGWRRRVLGCLLAAASAALFLFDLGTVTGHRALWLHTPLAAAGEIVVVVVVTASAVSALRVAHR